MVDLHEPICKNENQTRRGAVAKKNILKATDELGLI